MDQGKYLLEAYLTDEFGLSKREITLYLSLVRYGASTILELSEASSMNRSTTHLNVDSLTRKGLVTQLSKGRGSRRLIMAEPTDKLALILKNKKSKIESAEARLPDIVQELADLKEDHLPGKTIEVRRYRGKDEVRLIYEDVIKATEIRSYANLKEVSKFFPGNMQMFIDACQKNPDMRIYEIMEDSKDTRAYAQQINSDRTSCRLTTQKLHLASIDYLLFDGKIAAIEASKGITGVVIENDNIYENARVIHKYVWDTLPPYSE